MKKIKIFIFLVLLVGCNVENKKFGIWKDWQYQMPFKVTNKNNVKKENHLVYLEFNTIKFISAGKMLNTGADIRILDENNNEIPFKIFDGTLNSVNTMVMFEDDFNEGETKKYFLLFGNPNVSMPNYFIQDKEEIFLEKQTGNTECNIDFWQKESVISDNNLLPLAGKFFYKITIKPRPVYEDHYVNNSIKYKINLDIPITKNTYLEYDIYEKEKTEFAATIQGFVNENIPTWTLSFDDQRKICFWDTELDFPHINKWYHRRINLSSYYDTKLKELFFMINDKTITPRSQEIIFYFDNIRITSGQSLEIQKPIFYDFLFSINFEGKMFWMYIFLMIFLIGAIIRNLYKKN